MTDIFLRNISYGELMLYFYKRKDTVLTLHRYDIECEDDTIGKYYFTGMDVFFFMAEYIDIFPDEKKEALRSGITNAVYTNTLMLKLGEELYFSLGTNKNINIITVEDIEIFKAIYCTAKERWLKQWEAPFIIHILYRLLFLFIICVNI